VEKVDKSCRKRHQKKRILLSTKKTAMGEEANQSYEAEKWKNWRATDRER